jgi:hypothetical protein
LSFTLVLLALTLDAFCLPKTFHAATDGVRKVSVQQGKPPVVLPSLVLSHREIDLGNISMGQEKEGTFSIKNVGSESLSWTILTPETWFPLDKTELPGISKKNEEAVSLRISVLKRDSDVSGTFETAHLPVQMTLQNRSDRLTCVKDLPVGYHRNAIKIRTAAGMQRTVFIKFNLVLKTEEDIAISIDPPRLDFGTVRIGEQATRRIRLTNKSQEKIKWQVKLAGMNGMATDSGRHRYISFLNEDVAGKGAYATAPHLDKNLQLSGSWGEYQGFPRINGKCILKMDFWGSALGLYVKKIGGSGQFSVYIDNNPVKSYEFNGWPGEDEFYEISAADDFLEANHVLTLVLNGNGMAIEGVRVKRQDVLEGKRDWISIFPASGFTLKETDYINIVLNPTQTNPGVYANLIHVTSNNGNVEVPLSYEIVEDPPVQNIDIYRYRKGGYYLYISPLPSEEWRVTSKGFVKQGLAFRLFQPGSVGTVPFYRWYNPRIINQFYSYDLKKGNALVGYVYEGVVGHIATSRLKDTRELYRWFNPKTRRHFFTLDPKGEGMNKKGYVFEGIAGYVK